MSFNSPQNLINTILANNTAKNPIPIFSLKGKERKKTIKMVKEGDSIPSVPLTEKEPGNKVDLSKELGSGKGLIIGVPAAFSTYSHLPITF